MTSQPGARSIRRRNRHGRGFRGDVVPAHLPGFQTRRDYFDACVLDAMSPLYARFGQKLQYVQVLVEDVPGPAESFVGLSPIVLGRFFPGDREAAPRIIVYRRPIESRANDREELAELITGVIVENVAIALGIPPEDVDPHYGE